VSVARKRNALKKPTNLEADFMAPPITCREGMYPDSTAFQ
jgi:hypothetical protein